MSKNDLDNQKESAKTSIDSVVNSAENAIECMSDLTWKEKKVLKSEIEKKAVSAKNSIDAVTDLSNTLIIKSQKENVIEDIRKIQESAADMELFNVKNNSKADDSGKLTEDISNVTSDNSGSNNSTGETSIEASAATADKNK